MNAAEATVHEKLTRNGFKSKEGGGEEWYHAEDPHNRHNLLACSKWHFTFTEHNEGYSVVLQKPFA